MASDIIFVSPDRARPIIDSNLTNVASPTRFVAERFRSAHIAQIYQYLRTHEQPDPADRHASTLLGYTATSKNIDEVVSLQSHAIRFATVDLTKPASRISARGRNLPHLTPKLQSTNLLDHP